jgi:energy-coupling factor transport system substrate-specific component
MTEITTTDGRWRTRDILVVAVIAVAFGVFFWAFGFAWSALGFLGPAVNLLYGLWLLPALVAPLIVRRPGAALFAELVAASLSAFLGSQWAVDTLVSGLVQGAAAELVFAALRYRRFDLPVVIAAGLAASAAAFVHDWIVYYGEYAADVVVVIAGSMAISGLLLLPAGAILLVRALREAGALSAYSD